MVRVPTYVISRLVDRCAAVTERAVEQVVARRGEATRTRAARLRQAHPNLNRRELARRAIVKSSRIHAGSGAVSAIPALLPGPGTVIEIGAAISDTSLLTTAQVELILLIAVLYGHALDNHEGRRLDVLLTFGIVTGLVKLRRDGSVTIRGVRYGREEIRSAADTGLAAHINRRLVRQVMARVARRSAFVLLGREVPLLGIGVAAGYNHRSTRKVGAAAIRYFEHIEHTSQAG
jgi:hypothetical protein